MIVVGLTGSIGMGKSTTAKMFEEQGIPVYDSDRTVHDLYESDAVALVEARFPGVAVNGKIDRQKLGQQVIGKPDAMRDLEDIVHPLVRQREYEFLETHGNAKEPFVVLDNPLLFEMGRADEVDTIIVVTTSSKIQRERVLARPGMTIEKFEAILEKQVPDHEKREQADFIIDTSNGLEEARRQVMEIIEKLRLQAAH